MLLGAKYSKNKQKCLKIGVEAVDRAVLTPVFCVLSVKLAHYFLRFFAQQRTRQLTEIRDSNPIILEVIAIICEMAALSSKNDFFVRLPYTEWVVR